MLSVIRLLSKYVHELDLGRTINAGLFVDCPSLILRTSVEMERPISSNHSMVGGNQQSLSHVSDGNSLRGYSRHTHSGIGKK